jgi:hypothetical protein
MVFGETFAPTLACLLYTKTIYDPHKIYKKNIKYHSFSLKLRKKLNVHGMFLLQKKILVYTPKLCWYLENQLPLNPFFYLFLHTACSQSQSNDAVHSSTKSENLRSLIEYYPQSLT